MKKLLFLFLFATPLFAQYGSYNPFYMSDSIYGKVAGKKLSTSLYNTSGGGGGSSFTFAVSGTAAVSDSARVSQGYGTIIALSGHNFTFRNDTSSVNSLVTKAALSAYALASSVVAKGDSVANVWYATKTNLQSYVLIANTIAASSPSSSSASIQNTADYGYLNLGADVTGSLAHLDAGGGGSEGYFSMPQVGGATSSTQVTLIGNGDIGTIPDLALQSTFAKRVQLVDLTAQTAAISATTILAVTSSGFYQVNWVATITTAASVSAVLGGATGFQVKYTDADDSVVKTSNPTTLTVSSVNATGTSISGAFSGYCKTGTNLQYLFGYTSAGTAMAYNLHITVFAQ